MVILVSFSSIDTTFPCQICKIVVETKNLSNRGVLCLEMNYINIIVLFMATNYWKSYVLSIL